MIFLPYASKLHFENFLSISTAYLLLCCYVPKLKSCNKSGPGNSVGAYLFSIIKEIKMGL